MGFGFTGPNESHVMVLVERPNRGGVSDVPRGHFIVRDPVRSFHVAVSSSQQAIDIDR